MLGVGDGQFLQASVLQAGRQIFQTAIGFEWRSVGREDADAADRLQLATVYGLACIRQFVDKIFVGRHEYLKWRTLQYLRGELPG